MTGQSDPPVLVLDHLLPRIAKPARYAGAEWNSVLKDWPTIDLRVVLAYPDVYEVGIPNLGVQILYELINARHDALAERTYAPWVDMETALRAANLPLFAIESRHPVATFDILGFNLPYELTYSNVLNMLDLAQLPVTAADRDDCHTIVIAGGSCAFNPEPMADFIDLFAIGDGEEVIHDVLDALRDGDWRPRHGVAGSHRHRDSFLRHCADIPGIYVPSLYRARRTATGPFVRADALGVPRRVTKRFVSALPFAPVRPIVPYLNAVHDRAAVEIMRGCARGCRFCQAGIIYRSVRERPIAETLDLVQQLLANTGYADLGLVSLSSADYGPIADLVSTLTQRYPQLNISLPSLRVDSFSVDLARSIHRRKTGFTLAPEAGSQRMRDLVNKHVSEEDALRAAEAAFGSGWRLLKLYFMIGLPDETLDDVAGIVRLAHEILAIGRRHHRGRAQLNLSVNTFSPKPHTPFQWIAQDSESSLREKQDLLRRQLRDVKLSWSDNRVSFLETALARGDRRLGNVIHHAWRHGARFDAWSDQFRFDLWQDAFAACGLDIADFTHRTRPVDEVLPWDHIDCGVSKAYLKCELERSMRGQFTPDCHVHGQCSACGEFRVDPKCKEAVRNAALVAHV